MLVDVTGSGLSTVATYGHDRADNRTVVTTTDRSGGLQPIFRFYNGKHFYTLGFSEGINAAFTSEGIAFRAYASSGSGMAWLSIAAALARAIISFRLQAIAKVRV